jgi:hypothetical protein
MTGILSSDSPKQIGRLKEPEDLHNQVPSLLYEISDYSN